MSDALTRNIMAVKQYSEETREIVREFERRLNTYDTMLGKIEILEAQISALQVKLYSGGATHGD